MNKNIQLPRLNIGDWLIYENSGAYSLTLNSSFNAFPKTKVHNVINKKNYQNLKERLPNLFIMGGMPKNIEMGLDIDGCKI